MQENAYAIIVKQPDRLTPSCYYMRREQVPTIKEIQALGADVNEARGDSYYVEEISETLLAALGNHFKWLREQFPSSPDKLLNYRRWYAS